MYREHFIRASRTSESSMMDISIVLFMSSVAIFLIARQIQVDTVLFHRLKYNNRVQC